MNAHKQAKPSSSVVVIYEEAESRQAAVDFCDVLVQRFWQKQSFDMHWCSFAQISDRQSAEVAAGKAARADLVVLATRAHGTFPFEVLSWMESFAKRRGDREGELIGLVGDGTEASAKHIYLRAVAHRAGMDYLTQVPDAIGIPIPDSLDSFTSRADCVTSVLDEILHRPAPPPQL